MSNNTWFTADPHYHHKNIVKGVSNWEDKSGCRNFPDIPTHNKIIVDNINKNVEHDDVLYVLGDWSFGGIDKIWDFHKKIICKNIHLILGNHDHHIVKNRVLPNVTQNIQFDSVRTFIDGDEGSVVVKARELFVSVDTLKEIKVHGQRITLCHYAMRVWNKSHKGAWQLYGHSHNSLPPVGKQLDVGLESAKKLLGKWRPFKFQEIQKIMSHKEIAIADHHNANTTE